MVASGFRDKDLLFHDQIELMRIMLGPRIGTLLSGIGLYLLIGMGLE